MREQRLAKIILQVGRCNVIPSIHYLLTIRALLKQSVPTRRFHTEANSKCCPNQSKYRLWLSGFAQKFLGLIANLQGCHVVSTTISWLWEKDSRSAYPDRQWLRKIICLRVFSASLDPLHISLIGAWWFCTSLWCFLPPTQRPSS